MSQSTTATTVEFQVAEEAAPAAAAGGEAGGAATTTTEGTEAHGGEHHGVFPPLDTKTYPSQLFWLVIFLRHSTC